MRAGAPAITGSGYEPMMILRCATMMLLVFGWGLGATATEPPPLLDVADRELMITSKEGVEVKALLSTIDERTDRPLVVLLHAMGRDRDGLAPLAMRLAAEGFPALAVDMRGHGSSRHAGPMKLYSFKVVPPTDLHYVVDDLKLLIAEVESQGLARTDRLVLAGVGQGALVAAEAASRDPAVGALVIIDPPHDYAGFELSRDLSYLGERPALMICSAMPSSEERALLLSEYGHGERSIHRLETYDTHDRLLAPETGAVEEITRWLSQNFPSSAR